MNQPESARWIIAVDGGGSKIAIAASQLVVGRALPTSLSEVRTWNFAGTGSAHRSTWDLAQRNLANALRVVFDNLHDENLDDVVDVGCRTLSTTAQVEPTFARQSVIHMVVFALAGAGRATDCERVLEWARGAESLRKCEHFYCVADIDPLVDQRSVDVSGPCLAVILGTGSIVASRDQHGHLIRAGGWGPILGDECSGAALGVAALQHAATWFDSGAPLSDATRLVREVVTELTLGIAVNDDLNMAGFYRSTITGDASPVVLSSSRNDENAVAETGNISEDRSQLASTMIAVASDRTRAARLGLRVVHLALDAADGLALEVLEVQLIKLAWQVEQVLLRAWGPTSTFHLVLGGGLVSRHAGLEPALLAALQARGLTPERTLVADPLLMAIRFALLKAQAGPAG